MSSFFCEITDHNGSAMAEIVAFEKALRRKQLFSQLCLVMLFSVHNNFFGTLLFSRCHNIRQGFLNSAFITNDSNSFIKAVIVYDSRNTAILYRFDHQHPPRLYEARTNPSQKEQ
ncbi:hypothetical protein PT2222_140244 [Paraburkholderia tropica]